MPIELWAKDGPSSAGSSRRDPFGFVIKVPLSVRKLTKACPFLDDAESPRVLKGLDRGREGSDTQVAKLGVALAAPTDGASLKWFVPFVFTYRLLYCL